MEVSCWRLDGARATLSASKLSAVVDLERPRLGLHDLRVAGEPVEGWLLGVDVETATGATVEKPWTPADVYVRGCDLVATYRAPRGEPFNLQIYWRVTEASPRGATGIEAIVSVQTPQWEAYPSVTVASALPGDVDDSTGAAAIHRAWLERSYVEAARPGDFTLSLSHADSGKRLRVAAWRYGSQFMERGVIRRLCLRGAFVARHEDAATAMRLQKELAVEQPPLTA